MTPPCIVQAEVFYCHLEVPVRSLERLTAEVSSPSVQLESEHDQLSLATPDRRCSLKFRVGGARAQLTEVTLQEDDRGLFFQNVLGSLMVRFRGDLHVRLTWNTAQRNNQAPLVEVTIRRGETSYPGLGTGRNVVAPASLEGSLGSLTPEAEEVSSPSASPEEEAVERLLARGRAEWAEYQRLRAERAKRGG
jgi:hypothetical protein